MHKAIFWSRINRMRMSEWKIGGLMNTLWEKGLDLKRLKICIEVPFSIGGAFVSVAHKVPRAVS